MLVISTIVEHIASKATLDYLKEVQRQSIATVEGLDPLQAQERFFCAMTPSAEAFAAKYNRPVTPESRAQDCQYTLSPISGTGQGLPPAVVGHWHDSAGGNILSGVALALADTAWHLVVQPSILATIIALTTMVFGLFCGLVGMALLEKYPHFFLILAVFVLATLAGTCLAAFLLKWIMEGALALFGGLTNLAGLSFGLSGFALGIYNFVAKLFEVRVHETVDHLLPK
jgi:hypothetical protein